MKRLDKLSFEKGTLNLVLVKRLESILNLHCFKNKNILILRNFEIDVDQLKVDVFIVPGYIDEVTVSYLEKRLVRNKELIIINMVFINVIKEKRTKYTDSVTLLDLSYPGHFDSVTVIKNSRLTVLKDRSGNLVK